MRRSPPRRLAVALALLALPTTVAAQATAGAAGAGALRSYRVPVDANAAIVVTHRAGGVAELRVERGSAAFAVAGDTASLRKWITDVATLPVPAPRRTDELVDYPGVSVSQADGASLRMARVTPTGRNAYALVARQGWRRAELRVEWPAWSALYLVLTGGDPARPALALGGEPVWHEFQVATPATPRPDRAPAPEYPAGLRSRRAEGEVHYEVVVGRDGRPRMETFLVLESADPAFSAAVRSAVERWQFEPALKDGQPAAQMVYASWGFWLPK